ncbi:hypothetical protein BDV28DRAFT_148396 [Aspergillus coremiiformis]|uniref:Zn(2)-C6 fungal-type domain-containing protein n=1 Tax=Aspergillus coremiiformis TaxID=138285 RepID=A0A5N6Z888_9EURO|nr:hypothetical protein BDV28DRAFT_148396 [Aspergillus coremiiformis]
MVYRGKPSPACEPCRGRRLKCDQRRPSCSQCVRARRECSGYRDLTALSFHDQSEEVIGKVRRRQDPKTPRALSSSGQPGMPTTNHHQSSSPALVRSLACSMNDHATGFVLAHYVRRAKHTRGNLDFLPSLLQANTSPAVISSLSAVGLASLANIHMSPDLMLAARREYSAALAATSAALRNRAFVTGDSTLAAVELLSMYELVTCQSSPLVGRWLNHIEGSVKLIQLRGPDQLRRPAGLELFAQLRLQIALGNIYKKVHTPSWLMELSRESLKYRGDTGDQILDYVFRILVDVGNLVAAIRENTFDDPATVLRRALELDAGMIAWAQSVDSRWRYIVVEVTKTEDEKNALHPIYGDHYHIYPNLTVSMVWNHYRFTRILLHTVIGFLCTRSPRGMGRASTDGPSEKQSMVITQQLAEDICASVPYHLGLVGSSDGSSLGIPFAGAVIRLIWPLFIASDCKGSSPKMRAWIAQCLDKIGHGVGINMALTMARILRNDLHINWLTEREPHVAKKPIVLSET